MSPTYVSLEVEELRLEARCGLVFHLLLVARHKHRCGSLLFVVLLLLGCLLTEVVLRSNGVSGSGSIKLLLLLGLWWSRVLIVALVLRVGAAARLGLRVAATVIVVVLVEIDELIGVIGDGLLAVLGSRDQVDHVQLVGSVLARVGRAFGDALRVHKKHKIDND